jgi:hypothetical protein
MGAWGHKALESDAGLDVVDFITDYICSKYPNNEPVVLTLSELVSSMKEDGFFGQTFDDIDFFYDNSAMALTELYLMFRTTGALEYEDEDDETKDLKKRVKGFEGDQKSFDFLLQYLTDIKNEVPDEDGEREIVELWKDSSVYEEWDENLDSLISGLKAEINH